MQFSTRWCNRDGKPYCENCYHTRHFSEGNPPSGVREPGPAAFPRKKHVGNNSLIMRNDATMRLRIFSGC